MVSLLFVGTAIVYSIYAWLPFLYLNPRLHYAIGMMLSMTAGILWVTISRSVNKDAVVLYGVLFDAILTLCFAIVPLFVNGFTLTRNQSIGLIIMLIGMGIAKF